MWSRRALTTASVARPPRDTEPRRLSALEDAEAGLAPASLRFNLFGLFTDARLNRPQALRRSMQGFGREVGFGSQAVLDRLRTAGQLRATSRLANSLPSVLWCGILSSKVATSAAVDASSVRAVRQASTQLSECSLQARKCPQPFAFGDQQACAKMHCSGAAIVKSRHAALGAFGKLDPVAGKPQPRFLGVQTGRALGLLATFLRFSAEPFCILLAHRPGIAIRTAARPLPSVSV
jgi:hypothetical protein